MPDKIRLDIQKTAARPFLLCRLLNLLVPFPSELSLTLECLRPLLPVKDFSKVMLPPKVDEGLDMLLCVCENPLVISSLVKLAVAVSLARSIVSSHSLAGSFGSSNV